jgi:cytochrome c biogenesis protein CcmG/thiol:disulfide interchange protein DsbE
VTDERDGLTPPYDGATDPTSSDTPDDDVAAAAAGGAPIPNDATGRRWTSDRRWRVVVISLVPVVLLAGLLGFGIGRDPRATPQSQLIGRVAPNFALEDLRTGRTVHLSDFRGHPVVLNFWAAWCVDCIVEHPNLVSAWQRFGNEGAVFLSVLYQDTPSKAAAFLSKLPGSWPDLYDPAGRTALDYGVTGVPETVFITPDGHIAGKNISVSSYPLIELQLRSMSGGSA